jgi:hypothetical protein
MTQPHPVARPRRAGSATGSASAIASRQGTIRRFAHPARLGFRSFWQIEYTLPFPPSPSPNISASSR